MKRFLYFVLIFIFCLLLFRAGFAEEFKFTKTVIYPFDNSMNNADIIISNINGSIDVAPSKDKNCKIEIYYKLTTKDKEEAEKLADEITKILKTSTRLSCMIKIKKENLKSQFKDKKISTSIKAYIPSEYIYNADIGTINGGILIKNMKFASLKVSDINGEIDVAGEARILKIDNINGKISINLLSFYENNNISADIVNGAINIKTKKDPDAGFYIRASSVNGGTQIKIKNLITIKSKSFFSLLRTFEGKTKNYDKAKYKATIKAHTVNGIIAISDQ